jgi:hypothetical protein
MYRVLLSILISLVCYAAEPFDSTIMRLVNRRGEEYIYETLAKHITTYQKALKKYEAYYEWTFFPITMFPTKVKTCDDSLNFRSPFYFNDIYYLNHGQVDTIIVGIRYNSYDPTTNRAGKIYYVASMYEMISISRCLRKVGWAWRGYVH